MFALYGLALLTVVIVLYLFTLQSALGRCAPQNRVMQPALVWLQLVPVFGLYWHFRNVLALGESLENESRSRGVATHRPHQSLGIAAGMCLIVGYGILWSAALTRQVPNGMPSYMWTIARLSGIGSLVALAGVVCVALYWIRIARTSREVVNISPALQWTPSPLTSAPQVFCSACGGAAPGGRFCPHCGTQRTG